MQCRSLLLGTNDYRALANHNAEYNKDNTTRTVLNIAVRKKLPLNSLEIFITGDAFLYRMARNIVGTMIFCARKKIDLKDVTRALATGDRTLAGMTAPAHGLSLLKVVYPNHMKEFGAEQENQ
jgi:tRNA pseudouridine38-40 synthase